MLISYPDIKRLAPSQPGCKWCADAPKNNKTPTNLVRQFRRPRAPASACLVITLVLLALKAPLAQPSANAPTRTSGYIERAYTLSAADVLPANLIKGTYHIVDQKVTNDGYFNLYTIRSKFGVMKIEGRPLLETRIAEMNALAELDKLSSSKVFTDAAYKAGKGLILAPVKVVEKTAKTLSDPKKIGDTIAAVPEGAEKLNPARVIFEKNHSQ